MLDAVMKPRPVDYWGQDPEFPWDDWVHEVSNHSTLEGYWEWADHERALRRYAHVRKAERDILENR